MPKLSKIALAGENPMKKFISPFTACALIFGTATTFAFADTTEDVSAAVQLSHENVAAAGEKATALVDKVQTALHRTKGRVNINSADVETLTSIPGIDEKLAEAIAEYRNAKGNITSVEDLLNVEGMSNALLEKIAPLLQI